MSKILDYYTTIERPLAFVLQRMESRGICVDVPYLTKLKESLEARRRPLEASLLNELGSINLGSPKQLLEALNAKGIYPSFKNKPSTDKRALATVSNPVVQLLLEYSEYDTLISSFVTPYLARAAEGADVLIVHPFFNQCGTRTGRLSCSNPNLLQIPRRTDNGKLVRSMFIPRRGFVFGDCDFGQIEPRLMAHMSKDKNLCDLFNSDIDFHSYTADRLSISRDRAKILNLSVGYRATWKSVSTQLKCEREEAQSQIDAWWGMFPGLRRWQEIGRASCRERV
jgi:DNA polymerase-1